MRGIGGTPWDTGVVGGLLVPHGKVVLGLVKCSDTEHAGHKCLGLELLGVCDHGLELGRPCKVEHGLCLAYLDMESE